MSNADDASIASSDHAGGSLSPLRSSTSPDSSIDDGSMPLPPEGHFPSLEALEEHAQAHAKAHGYATARIRWKLRYKTQSKCRKYTIGCHCSSKYRDRSKGRARKRQKSTVKTGCQFSFHGLQNEDGTYNLRHRDSLEFRMHNHGPTQNPAVHHQHRRLRGLALEHAKALIAAGLEVKDIVTVLSKSEHVDVPPLAKDITNLMQRLQVLELNGNTLIDALKAAMDEQGWVYEYKTDQNSRLTRLFMASKASLEYAKKHPDVLIMDSTYKTNRFEMLLLNIISKLYYSIDILF